MYNTRRSRLIGVTLLFVCMQITTFMWLLLPESLLDYEYTLFGKQHWLWETLYVSSIYTYMVCTFGLALIIVKASNDEQLNFVPVLWYALLSTAYDLVSFVLWGPSMFSNYVELTFTLGLFVYLFVIWRKSKEETKTPAISTWHDVALQLREMAEIARSTDGKGFVLLEKVRTLADMMEDRPMLSRKGWPVLTLFDYKKHYHFSLEVKPDLLIHQPFVPLTRLIELLNTLAPEPELGDVPQLKIFVNYHKEVVFDMESLRPVPVESEAAKELFDLCHKRRWKVYYAEDSISIILTQK